MTQTTATATKRKTAETKLSKAEQERLTRLGKDMACIYLSDHGFKILERDWKGNTGTIALVAEEGNALVFLDVITRAVTQPGFPEEKERDQRRQFFESLVLEYLKEHSWPRGPVRYDIIAICMTGKEQCLLRHHRDALGAAG